MKYLAAVLLLLAGCSHEPDRPVVEQPAPAIVEKTTTTERVVIVEYWNSETRDKHLASLNALLSDGWHVKTMDVRSVPLTSDPPVIYAEGTRIVAVLEKINRE